MADYDEELSETESEVDRLTRQVSGYERVGQSTPKYRATGERQSVGFPVDSGFATARPSRERASAQRESTEADRIEVEIEKLREQLRQYEELRSMREFYMIHIVPLQHVNVCVISSYVVC